MGLICVSDTHSRCSCGHDPKSSGEFPSCDLLQRAGMVVKSLPSSSLPACGMHWLCPSVSSLRIPGSLWRLPASATYVRKDWIERGN
jgi:hypothetical protein